MRKVQLLAAAVLLVPQLGYAQIRTTTATATTVKSSVEQPVLVTEAQRNAFKVSLQANPLPLTQTDPPMAALTWSSIPGASTYTVLRAGQVGGPYVSIPLRDALNYRARYLPGKPFYFRVVALGSKGIPIDTTSAAALVTQPVDATIDGGISRHIHASCSAIVPSGVTLTWQKPSGVDDAVISIMQFQNQHFAAVSTSTQSGTSYTQTGLPAGTYKADIYINYTMQDYPVAGQSTSVHAGLASVGFTLPVTTAGTCQ